MKTKKELIVLILINEKEKMAISYGVLPGADIRKKCYEIADLIQTAKSAEEAVALIVLNVLRHSGYVYGLSEKSRAKERTELKRRYGITFSDRSEIHHENGLMIFRKEVIDRVKKEHDILAEISCYLMPEGK